MKHIIETGCDGATLCFFDPAALPENFDERVNDECYELIEELQQQQRFWFGGSGGDGSYTFHLYIDEDPPPALRSKATVINHFTAFAIPSGQLCICGAEYAANNPLTGSQFTPKGGLNAYSGMGSIVELAAGHYQLELLEIEWSDEDYEDAQETVLSKEQLRQHRRLEIAMASCFFLGVIVALFSLPVLLTTLYDYFFPSPNNCSITQLQDLQLPALSLLAGGLLFTTGWLLARRHNHSTVTQALNAIEQEMPAYVLIAKKQTGVQA